MLTCFTTENTSTVIPITLLSQQEVATWLNMQSEATQSWLKATQFRAEAGEIRLIPAANATIERVICCVENKESRWQVGHLPFALPEGVYQLEEVTASQNAYAIAWGLGAYQFQIYKKPKRQPAQLMLSKNNLTSISSIVEAIYFVRDCINTPADDMGPTQFAMIAEHLAKEFGATLKQYVGEELLQQHYASIYTVGRASDDAPRLLDLRWGQETHPKVTLVGKGVCFDTGGLDIKPSAYMLLMKKDMAGGAHVLGLARMIMAAQLPICLRVLIPLVENAVSGNAYRPGDIIKSRKGLTIEIGNTDAEGRVVLADALTEAVNDKPDLLIDIATLTGAASVALGGEIAAVFSHHDQLVQEVISQGEKQEDPIWRLPLFGLYREYLNSTVADINNNASEPRGGAITAALFLNEFVPKEIPWLHFDLMAWNLRTRPGRPQGGEAMALRALFAYLQERFKYLIKPKELDSSQ
jgi:leucyl aminopeptidase